MVSKRFVAAWFALALGLAQAAAEASDVSVYTGQPGPYEIHQYLHRPNSFDRAPYFATQPPVYYGTQRMSRSYGWTSYPYLGTQYQESLADVPENVSEKSATKKDRNKKSGQGSKKAK